MRKNIVINLKQYVLELIEHLRNENILTYMKADNLDGQTFNDLVVLLRDSLKEEYPETKLKRTMRSIHYANGFGDLSLKQSAFLLDEVEQYLCTNKFLDHAKSVEYFNKRITSDRFEINQESLVLVMLESLLYSKKKSK
ncbi:hypothetical protein [Solobacterium moorei]|uniref:hypothetical protein n=1 Tax=Solobacterium moorei TaxID=102148 RepID=UPI0023F573D1|nr:hypothetical protein [Solobacterium moorei]